MKRPTPHTATASPVRPRRAQPPPYTGRLPSQRIAQFGRSHMVHGKGEFAGRPFLLQKWEAEAIGSVYDELTYSRGALIRRKREALLGVGKKNGKTHLGALLGAYGLYADGYPQLVDDGRWAWRQEFGAEVYNVAGSKDQAKVLFEIAKGFVERSPLLKAMSRIYKDAIEVPETDSVWRVLPADARLAHGPNPSTAIIDEIWVHRDAELYEAFASAGAARRQPLLWVITTAGFDQSSIAYRLYEAGGNRRTFFRWYEAPEGCALDDYKAMKLANPSTWVTKSYLRDELARARKSGNELQYRRWHGNQWTTAGTEQAIPFELWDSGKARPSIPNGASVVVGVDAAPKHDSTGIAVVHRDEPGVHHARVTIMRADPDTGYLDFGALEELMRDLVRTYDVQRILVDPYYMVRSMVLLQEEGLPIEEFPQSDVRMVPASTNLYELLIQGRLRHGGRRELRAQVQAAAKRVTERGWRLVKRGSTGKIDGLIALAMACYELERGVEEETKPFLFV